MCLTTVKIHWGQVNEGIDQVRREQVTESGNKVHASRSVITQTQSSALLCLAPDLEECTAHVHSLSTSNFGYVHALPVPSVLPHFWKLVHFWHMPCSRHLVRSNTPLLGYLVIQTAVLHFLSPENVTKFLQFLVLWRNSHCILTVRKMAYNKERP